MPAIQTKPIFNSFFRTGVISQNLCVENMLARNKDEIDTSEKLLLKWKPWFDNIHDFQSGRGDFLGTDKISSKRGVVEPKYNYVMMYLYFLSRDTFKDLPKIPFYHFSTLSYPGNKVSQNIDDIERYCMILSYKQFWIRADEPRADITTNRDDIKTISYDGNAHFLYKKGNIRIAAVYNALADFFIGYTNHGQTQIPLLIDMPKDINAIIGCNNAANKFAYILLQESAHDSSSKKTSLMPGDYMDLFKNNCYTEFTIPRTQAIDSYITNNKANANADQIKYNIKRQYTSMVDVYSNYTSNFSGMRYESGGGESFYTDVSYAHATEGTTDTIKCVLNDKLTHPTNVPNVSRIIKSFQTEIEKYIIQDDAKRSLERSDLKDFYDKLNTTPASGFPEADGYPRGETGHKLIKEHNKKVNLQFTLKREGDFKQAAIIEAINKGKYQIPCWRWRTPASGINITAGLDKDEIFWINKGVLVTGDRVLHSICVDYDIPNILMLVDEIIAFKPKPKIVAYSVPYTAATANAAAAIPAFPLFKGGNTLNQQIIKPIVSSKEKYNESVKITGGTTISQAFTEFKFYFFKYLPRIFADERDTVGPRYNTMSKIYDDVPTSYPGIRPVPEVLEMFKKCCKFLQSIPNKDLMLRDLGDNKSFLFYETEGTKTKDLAQLNIYFNELFNSDILPAGSLQQITEESTHIFLCKKNNENENERFSVIRKTQTDYEMQYIYYKNRRWTIWSFKYTDSNLMSIITQNLRVATRIQYGLVFDELDALDLLVEKIINRNYFDDEETDKNIVVGEPEIKEPGEPERAERGGDGSKTQNKSNKLYGISLKKPLENPLKTRQTRKKPKIPSNKKPKTVRHQSNKQRLSTIIEPEIKTEQLHSQKIIPLIPNKPPLIPNKPALIPNKPALNLYLLFFYNNLLTIDDNMSQLKLVQQNNVVLTSYFELFNKYESDIITDDDQYRNDFDTINEFEVTRQVELNLFFYYLLDDLNKNQNKINEVCYGLLEYFLHIIKSPISHYINDTVSYIYSGEHISIPTTVIHEIESLITSRPEIKDSELFKNTIIYFESIHSKVIKKTKEIKSYLFKLTENSKEEKPNKNADFIQQYLSMYGFLNMMKNTSKSPVDIKSAPAKMYSNEKKHSIVNIHKKTRKLRTKIKNMLNKRLEAKSAPN